MKAVAVPLQQLISKVKDNANAFVFSVLVVSYQALEAEFPCSCKPQPGYCSAYMIMPCLIIAVLMLSTDLPFQRAWRYTRSKGSCHFGCVLFRRSVKAVCIGLLWVGSVLIQADWFVCCNNQNPRQVAELQCQTKTDVTAAGTAVVTIAEMKMVSRMIGMSLLFAVFFTAAFLLSTWTVYADVCCPKCCRRDVQVHELILEVGEDVVERVMKEEQHSKLSESMKGYIAQGKWVNCLDVVEELIDTIGGEKKEDHHEDKKSQQNEEEDSV
ncbi:uncharacterized protein LOC121612392 isoform X3 [Chelmon rostratus]|uniref:uncharacterized protein LOC121612392 isoform X3 n=1 Tax=Chelmon rostratus TaxID=109905 RepID=UPI001BE5FEE0|nr:uncharacterized protein LOC121612392 isoform X3 [Chelmon rostratus]